MSQPTFEQFVIALRATFDVPPGVELVESTRLVEDLALDSLALYELLSFLDEEAPGGVDAALSATLKTVGDAHALLCAYRADASALGR